jgi:hypothetical protein
MLKKLSLLIFLFYITTGYADPWFTGPLLAEPAETIPLGHWNFQIFNFSTFSDSIYDAERNTLKTNANSNIQILPQLTYGLANDLDFELDPVFIQNKTGGKTYNSIGDTTVILGMQVLRQKENLLKPDLRVTLEEILPSGRYDNLIEENNGTDALGMGSYQTNLVFNFQHMQHVIKEHYLNSHLSFSYLYASSVHIRGISTYGGNALTRGDLKPGSVFMLDIAEELNLTQNFGIVLESFIQYQQADRFIGDYGKISNRVSASEKKYLRSRLFALFPTKRNISALFVDSLKIGNGTLNLFSLAPAIEYSISENYGFLIGSWFSVGGKNTPNFASFAISFNAYV